MRTPAFFALLITAAICLPALAADPAALLARGRSAEKDGNVAAARLAYTEALRIQPGNPHARYALSQLNANQEAVATVGRQKKLEAVIIPQVEFDKVDIGDALDALRIIVEKETKKDYAPNFMVKDPAKQFEGKEITLKLKAVPAKVILEMILEQARGKARYDEHAIVIEPRS